jgi:hypothetical protein
LGEVEIGALDDDPQPIATQKYDPEGKTAHNNAGGTSRGGWVKWVGLGASVYASMQA